MSVVPVMRTIPGSRESSGERAELERFQAVWPDNSTAWVAGFRGRSGAGERWIEALLLLPRLATESQPAAGFSATLLLPASAAGAEAGGAAGAGQPGEQIARAVVAFAASVVPAPDGVSHDRVATPVEPLLPRRGRWRIVDQLTGKALAETTVDHPSGRVSMSIEASGAHAASLAAAARGADVALLIEGDLEVASRRGPPAQPLELSVDAGRLHSALAARVGADGIARASDIHACLERLIEQGEAMASPMAGALAESAITGALDAVAAAARAVVVREPALDDPSGPAFRLRDFAMPGVMITMRLEGGGEPAQRLTVRRPLGEMLREGLTAEQLAAAVSVLAMRPDGRGVGPALRSHLVAGGRSRSLPAERLVARGSQVMSLMARATIDQARPAPAATLMATSAVASPLLAAHANLAAVSNLSIHTAAERPQALPIVESDRALLWKDRLESERHWYAPEFRVVVPPANQQAEGSPFLFTFEQRGHDAEGRPGLQAKVKMTFRQSMPDEVKAEVDRRGLKKVDPVACRGVSVQLRIPYRDEHGASKVQSVRAAKVARSDDLLTAEFELTDSWARLAYGALARQGFQETPAELEVGYTFGAYVPIGKKETPTLSIASGGKLLRPPVMAARSAGGAGELALSEEAGGGRVQLPLEPPRGPAEPAAARDAERARLRPAFSLAVNRPQLAALAQPVIRPQLTLHASILTAATTVHYAQRDFVRSRREPALVACEQHGVLYREQQGEASTTVGCKDAWTLGTTALQLYDRIDSQLGGEAGDCRVYRSLQSPRRFLIVPGAYRIGRFEPDDGPDLAYNPAVHLYAIIDASDDDASRCVILSTLAPDLPQHRRMRIRAAIVAHFGVEPIIELPTEIEAEIEYNLALPPSGVLGIEIEAVRLHNGFQISLATDPAGVRQLFEILRSVGVRGEAAMRLADGATLSVPIEMRLDRVIGPVSAGPLSVLRLAGAEVELTNLIDRAVAVSAIAALHPDGAIVEHRVDDVLAPGATLTLEAPAAGELAPVFTVEGPAIELQEIRIGVEQLDWAIACLCLVNFANHDLAAIELTLRIKGVEGERTVAFTEQGQQQEAVFVLPLTSYLSDPVLEVKAKRIGSAGEEETADWKPFALQQIGSVLGVTWEMIAAT